MRTFGDLDKGQQAKINARRVKLLHDDLRAALATDHGRRLIAWIVLGLGSLESGTWDPNIRGDSTLHTHHAEGRRSVAVDIRNEIHLASPKTWPVVQAEFIEQLETDIAHALGDPSEGDDPK